MASTSHPHYHVINGKRRCLTHRMPKDQHDELQIAHQEARLAISLDQDSPTLSVGIVFHGLTPNTSKNYQEFVTLCQQILQVMNSGFNHAISPLQDIDAIEKGKFLSFDPLHKDLYQKFKNLSDSPRIEFLMAHKPLLSYIPFAHKHSGSDTSDMDYWDDLLKLQMSPAIDPEHLYNIWIVMDVTSVLLGYGNFPKVNPTFRDISLDGFVYFISPSPYDLHYTAIHESG